MKAMEMAYTSTKKIIGESTYGMLNRNPGNGTGGHSTIEIGESEFDPMKGEFAKQERPVPGFGKSRYKDDE